MHTAAVPVQPSLPQQPQLYAAAPQPFGVVPPQQYQQQVLPPQQYQQQVLPPQQYGYPPNLSAAQYQSMPPQNTLYSQQPNQSYVMQGQSYAQQPAPSTPSALYQQPQDQAPYTTHK